MKNRILNLVKSAFLCVLFISCSSDDGNARVEVELGDNYLVAKIDGEDFIVTEDKVSFERYTVSNANFLTVVAEVDGEILRLEISGSSFPPQMLGYNSGPYYSQNLLILESVEWVGTSEVQTEVVENTSITGTFSFTLENIDDNSIKTVTDGEFLYTY